MTDDLDFEHFALIIMGHSAFQLLWSGMQLDIFDFLSKNPGASRAEIAEKTGLQPQPARVLLTGLAALKLLLKDGDSYRNSGIADELLVRNRPGNMVDVAGWQAHIVYPGLLDFLESLKHNTNVGLRRFPGEEDNLYQRLAHDPFLEKVFHDAMSSLSLAANAMLVEKVDFSTVRHLVDAGGGDATNAITLARAHPHLRITVFDAPTVCERATANIAAAGLSERIDAYPGDFFKRDFPPGIDCILFAHMMTIWTLEKDTELLRVAHGALPLGGRVILFNMMGNDSEDGPLSTALGSPYFLAIATGQGMLHSWRDYEQCLNAAGFLQTQRLALPRDHGVLTGVK